MVDINQKPAQAFFQAFVSGSYKMSIRRGKINNSRVRLLKHYLYFGVTEMRDQEGSISY